MTNLNFDDFVKKEFSGYSPEVSPHIWERIATERRKRRPAGFWYSLFRGRNLFILLGLLMVAGGSALVYNLSSGNRQTNTAENIAANPKNPESTGNNHNNSNSDPNDNNNLSNNSNSASNTTATDRSVNNINDPASSANGPQANRINMGNPGEANPGSNSNYSPLISSSGELQQGSDQNRNRRTVKSGRYNFNVTNAAATKDPLAAKKQTSINEQDGDEPVTDDQNIASNTLPATGTLMGRLMFAAEKISARSAGGKPKFDKAVPEGKAPKCPRIDDPAGNKQYVELYAGPDYAKLSFNDTANSAYLQKRKETEKFSSAYSAGARYTRVFNNGMSLRTGINYSQINEKFSYQKGGIIQYVYILDQTTGDTIGSYTVSGTRYKTTYNRYRTIDIPLQVGYEMGNGRIHANIGAGAMINVYSWQRGDVLDTSLQPVNITTGKSSSPYGYKTNIGLGFIGSASIYYKLTDKLHLLAEPYVRYNLRPMSKDNLTLTQKYNTVGLRLGVRLDLQ